MRSGKISSKSVTSPTNMDRNIMGSGLLMSSRLSSTRGSPARARNLCASICIGVPLLPMRRTAVPLYHSVVFGKTLTKAFITTLMLSGERRKTGTHCTIKPPSLRRSWHTWKKSWV